MATFKITGPDGNSYNVSAPDDATEDQVLAYAQKNFKLAAAPTPSKPFGQQLNEEIANVPRQLGLTARHGIEGVGGMLDMLATPIRAGMNALGADIKPGAGQYLANKLGLPQPRDATERVVGDATRMLAGSAVPIGIGGTLAKGATGTSQAVGQMLASNPGAQFASAGAAGGAGGYTRETGGDDTSQLVASLAAGVATPFAMNAATRAGNSVAAAGRRVMAPPAIPQVQVDVTINSALRDSGMNLAQLPAEVARGIRADVSKAMQMGENLSPDAVRRLADYRLTGLTPTAAKLTLDPAAVTQQENLAKLGINSKDPAAQALGQTKNANNRQLVTGLNTLGANTADDAIAGGSKIMGALDQRNARAQSLINDRYAAARATDGRAAALDPYAFTQRANNLLDEALLGGKLPADVRNLLNKAAKGEMPLTVDVAEQFKTRIGELQRSTIDMAERKALGMVRGALDETPLLPGQNLGQSSIDAFNKARSLNRSWMGIVERTPALQAVRDGIEPDKFVQQFIVGAGPKSNVMDVAMLKNSIKGSPEAMDAVRTQITASLKKAALNGAADETGNFSQSAFKKALDGIGERKLNLFFPADAVAQLKALSRVASYEQFQPAGSAVNNSNTAATGMAAMLDRIGSSALLSKIPFGKLVQDPLQNIAVGMNAKRSMNVPEALLNNGPRMPALPAPRQPAGMMLSPALFGGFETEEDRKRRLQAGSLFP